MTCAFASNEWETEGVADGEFVSTVVNFVLD